MEREIVRDGWRAMKRSQGRADSSRVEILALTSHHSYDSIFIGRV